MSKREDVLDELWFEFMDWCKQADTGIYSGKRYEYFATPTEENFWFWYLEFKHE